MFSPGGHHNICWTSANSLDRYKSSKIQERELLCQGQILQESCVSNFRKIGGNVSVAWKWRNWIILSICVWLQEDSPVNKGDVKKWKDSVFMYTSMGRRPTWVWFTWKFNQNKRRQPLKKIVTGLGKSFFANELAKKKRVMRRSTCKPRSLNITRFGPHRTKLKKYLGLFLEYNVYIKMGETELNEIPLSSMPNVVSKQA